MLSQKHYQKITVSLFLLFISFITISNRQYHLNNSPYFIERLAKLRYTLLPDTAVAPLESWWSPFGVDITGIAAAAPEISIGLSLLAVLSRVLDIPLSQIAFYPLIPLLTAPAVYLLATRVLDQQTAIIPATIVTIYAGAFYSFQEYVFGRYTFFPLFLAAAIWYMVSHQKRFFVLALLFLVGLKFTAPGTEVVALISLIVISVLYNYTSSRQGAVPREFVLLSALTFFAINPKLYFGVLLGLFHSGDAVTLQASGEGVGAQLLTALDQFLSIFTSSSSTPHPLTYGGRPSTAAGQVRTSIMVLLVVVTTIYGLHELFSTLRTRTLNLRFVIVVGIITGVAVNVLFRAVLLGRFGPKGLLVVLPVAAVIALRKYLSQPRVQAIGVGLILVLGATVITVHDPVTQSFAYEQSEQTAAWQAEFTETPQSNLVDFQTSGNLEYYYADQRVSRYWEAYEFVDFNATVYSDLIAGKGIDVDYLLIDQDTEYALKPQSYGALEPLENHLDQIVYANEANKVYSNGNTAIYQL